MSCRPLPVLLLPILCGAILLPMGGCWDSGSSSPDGPGEKTSEETSGKASRESSGLSGAQRKRLGPVLQRLLAGDTLATEGIQKAGMREGAPVYSVFVVSADPEALREAGLSLTSVRDSLITARMTKEEIRRAASVPSVRQIRGGRSLGPADGK